MYDDPSLTASKKLLNAAHDIKAKRSGREGKRREAKKSTCEGEEEERMAVPLRFLFVVTSVSFFFSPFSAR